MNNFLKNIIFKDWQYKLLAFLIAFVLWMYVVGNQNLNIKINVPIEFDNYPVNLKLTGNFQNSVELLLEGRRDIISRIDKNNLKVKIDLKTAKEGKNNYVLTSKRIENLPDGIIIKDISPSRVILDFQAIKVENKKDVKE